LRIGSYGGLDVELVAEIEGGSVKWQACEFDPKVEWVALSPAAKALKEISLQVHREAVSTE